MSNKKSFLYYSRLSVSEGRNTEPKTSQLCLERFDKDIYKKCRQCCQVFAIKKKFKKTMILTICVLNFHKKKTKLTHSCILYGRIMQNIEFLQTCIVHILIIYSDANQLEVIVGRKLMKNLTII